MLGSFVCSTCILLAITDNLQRFFIDTFASIAPLLKPLLLQLKDSILFSNSIQCCDQLRAQHVLNPANEGDKMVLPSKLNVSILFSNLFTMRLTLRVLVC
jgi:hypothetical protein